MKKVINSIIVVLILSLITILSACNMAQKPDNQLDEQNKIGMKDIPNGENNPGIKGQPNTNMNGVSGTALDKLGTPGADPGKNQPNAPNTNMPNTASPNAPNTNTPNKSGLDIPKFTNTAESNKKAQTISDEICKVDGVEKATVIVSEDTALVGIKCADDNFKDGEDKSLKDEIAKKIKEMNPEIKNVSVSESPNLYQRINNLSKDVGKGKPIKGLGNEFKEIINKITPSM